MNQMSEHTPGSIAAIGYHLLLIEDNDGDAFLVQEYLEEYLDNFSLNHARSHAEAIAAIKSERHKLDLVLLDLSLPDQFGTDLLRDVLNHLADIPVVVITGNVDLSFSIKSLEMGVSDYLLKDEFNAFALYKSVVYAVEKSRMRLEMLRLNSRLEAAMERAKLGYWSYSLSSKTFLFSKELQNMLYAERPMEKCGFTHFKAMIDDLDRHQFELDFFKSIEQKLCFRSEIRLNIGKFVSATFFMKGDCTLDNEGRVVSLEGIMQDVTSDRSLENHRVLLESVITHAKDAVVITEGENLDAPGPIILYVNNAFTDLTGYKPYEVLGKSPRMMQGVNTDRTQLAKLKAAMRNLQPCQIEVLNYHKNKTPYWVEMSVVPVLDKSGRCTHYISIERDVTERKRSEQLLIELTQNLESQVEERTKELKTAHQLLGYHYTELKDSIAYAKNVQSAVLRSEQDLAALFENSFVFNQPRDVVSGDFMWCHKVSEHVSVVALVDCTGHGVPGALLSMIANQLLEQSLQHISACDPCLILNYVHQELNRIYFRQSTVYKNYDGMDASLCVIDYRNRTVQFCGARQGAYFASQGKVKFIKGSKFTIGGLDRDQVESVLQVHSMTLEEAGTIYMSTDGFSDQFGGPAKKKMLKKPLVEKLSEIHTLAMPSQKVALKKFFCEWRGLNEQTDDVLVLAFKPNE